MSSNGTLRAGSFLFPAETIPCRGLILHQRVDADGILAAVMLQQHAREIFPGINKAPIFTVSANARTYEGMDFQESLAQGYLPLDVLGGPFDEHERPNWPGSPGECAASLAYNFLAENDCCSAQELWAWLPLVERVKRNDTRGRRKSNGGVADLMIDGINNMHRYMASKGYADETREDRVFCWAATGFLATFETNLETITGGKLAFDAGRQFWRALPGGDKVLIAVVVSDHESVLSYASQALSSQPDVLIQRSPTRGLSQAHWLRHDGDRAREQIDLDWVHQNLIDAEEKAGGDARVWFFHKDANRVLNGSLKATSAEPTRLSLEQIETAVLDGLNKAAAEKLRQKKALVTA